MGTVFGNMCGLRDPCLSRWSAVYALMVASQPEQTHNQAVLCSLQTASSGLAIYTKLKKTQSSMFSTMPEGVSPKAKALQISCMVQGRHALEACNDQARESQAVV